MKNTLSKTTVHFFYDITPGNGGGGTDFGSEKAD